MDRPRVLMEPDVLATYAGHDAILSRLVDLDTAEQVSVMVDPQILQIMAKLHK